MGTGLALRLIVVAAVIATAVSCADDEPQVVVMTVPSGASGSRPGSPGGNADDAELNVTFTAVGPRMPGLVDLEAAPAGGFYAVYRDGVIQLMATDGSEQREALRVDDVVDTDIEQGLLAVAVHPDEQHAYINYTAAASDRWAHGDSVIVEYELQPNGAFDVASARVVLVLPQPSDKHNAHELEFGPDGYLYVGVGDGSFANDPSRRALDRSSLLGKILRIDPAAAPDALAPAGNPFLGKDETRPEIWSFGLRNPWRFTFDALTGDLWITDVGQSGNEEVDVARARNGRNAGRAVNFGWSAYEGRKRFNEDQQASRHRRPVHTYQHKRGRCAIVGAAVYRGDRIPALEGGFVFGDFCSGAVWVIGSARPDAAIQLGTVAQASAVREVDGELYVLSLGDGLYRVDPA